MTTYDAPNQQVVRADGSAPWEEGSGGEGGTAPGSAEEKTLDQMTKAELLDVAAARGVEASDQMTKDEIRAAIDAQ